MSNPTAHYPFAGFAERTLGVSLSVESNKLKAAVFKRSRVAGSNPISWKKEIDETPKDVGQPFTFSLEVADQQTALLAFEVKGWGVNHYRSTAMHLLGHQSPFSVNGDEVKESLPNTPDPAGRTYAARKVTVTVTPGATPVLSWKSDNGSGSHPLDAANPAEVISLRLVGTAKGTLTLDAASPWGAQTHVSS